MANKPAMIGRVLAVFGIGLFMLGLGFSIGHMLGFFKVFPYTGVIVMFLGNIIGWFGKSLAAGRLTQDIKEKMELEANDSFRLETTLSPATAVLVAIGFTLEPVTKSRATATNPEV